MQRKLDPVLRLATPSLGPPQAPLISDVRRRREAILGSSAISSRRQTFRELESVRTSDNNGLADAVLNSVLFD